MSEQQQASLNELKASHPMPWGYQVVGPGLIMMFDATGKEVPLLKMLDFVQFITGRLK